MLTLGIDPGTATTGYGLIREKGDRLVFVDHGVVTTSSKESPDSRLRQIYNHLKSIIIKHGPDVIAIEKLFFGVNTKTAMAVGQVKLVTLFL